MSRMRLHTRLMPGLWLSQPVSCLGCLIVLAAIAFIGMCVLGGFLAALDGGLRELVPAMISLWGR